MLDRKPKALSGGQRQRVALGRALVRDPKVFLYDEPLSNLDAKLRVSTRAELKSLHYQMKTTSIYVTHDQAEAMTLGERICVMNKAVIQQVAQPMEIYDRPVNRFVAGFLGTPSMNFFVGQLLSTNGERAFNFGEQRIALPSQGHHALSACNDGPMVLGIRPEHLSPRPYDGQSHNTIASVVRVVETLGDRTEVHLKTGEGSSFVASLGAHEQLSVGASLLSPL